MGAIGVFLSFTFPFSRFVLSKTKKNRSPFLFIYISISNIFDRGNARASLLVFLILIVFLL
jgi:hypothetical protein